MSDESTRSIKATWSDLLRRLEEQQKAKGKTIVCNWQTNKDISAISHAVAWLADLQQFTAKLIKDFTHELFRPLIEDLAEFSKKLTQLELEFITFFNEILFAAADGDRLITTLPEAASTFTRNIMLSDGTKKWIGNKHTEVWMLKTGLESCWFSQQIDWIKTRRDVTHIMHLRFNIDLFRDPFLKTLHADGPSQQVDLPSNAPINEGYWFHSVALRTQVAEAFSRFEKLYNYNNDHGVTGMSYLISPFQRTNTSIVKAVASVELQRVGENESHVMPDEPRNLQVLRLPKAMLIWSAPTTGVATSYRYSYHPVGESTWISGETFENFAPLALLKNGTRYEFRVQSLCLSVVCAETSLITKVFLSEKIAKKATVLPAMGRGKLKVVQPEIKIFFEDRNTMIRRIEIGKPSINYSVNNTVLVMGATGTGKSTWINSVVNHFYEIDYPDMMRLKVITEGDENDAKRQLKSMTKWITSYVLHRHGKSGGERLTLIDTPGFGDTEGIQRDNEITAQFSHFFLNPNMKDHLQSLNAIGMILPGSTNRIGATQYYVMNKVFQLFSKDIAANLFWLVTSSDSERPNAIEAIDKGSLPKGKCFTFNNGHLFEEPVPNSMAHHFWRFNFKGMTDFFTALRQTPQCSLESTRNVILEREMLSATLDGLKQQINHGIFTILEHRLLTVQLREKQQNLAINPQSTLTRTVFTTKLLEKPDNSYSSLICTTCRVNCHAPCEDLAVRVLWSKWFCSVMYWNGMCSVCPGMCAWSEHNLDKKEFLQVAEQVSDEMPYLMEQYGVSDRSEKGSVSRLVEAVAEAAGESQRQITALIKRAQSCQNRLAEIALKDYVTPLGYYIEEMITKEREEKSKFSDEIIAILKDIKHAAETPAAEVVVSSNDFSRESENVQLPAETSIVAPQVRTKTERQPKAVTTAFKSPILPVTAVIGQPDTVMVPHPSSSHTSVLYERPTTVAVQAVTHIQQPRAAPQIEMDPNAVLTPSQDTATGFGRVTELFSSKVPVPGPVSAKSHSCDACRYASERFKPNGFFIFFNNPRIGSRKETKWDDSHSDAEHARLLFGQHEKPQASRWKCRQTH